MQPSAPSPVDLSVAWRTAAGALMDVAARDGLHLSPREVTRAIEARALSGLRAIEAFVRRMLILIALQFEHEITVDISPRPHPKTTPKPRKPREGIASLRILKPDLDPPERLGSLRTGEGEIEVAPDRLPAAPLLARIARLERLLADPEARGRRLAYALARRHHGPLAPPSPHALPARMGTEFTALYRALGTGLYRQSQDRPPPAQPRPPPRPRVRQL